MAENGEVELEQKMVEKTVLLKLNLSGSFDTPDLNEQDHQCNEEGSPPNGSPSVSLTFKWNLMNGEELECGTATTSSEGSEDPQTTFSLNSEAAITVNEELVHAWVASMTAHIPIQIKANIQQRNPDGSSKDDPLEVDTELRFDCADLLVRDTKVSQEWSSSSGTLPNEMNYLRKLAASAEVWTVETQGEEGSTPSSLCPLLPTDLERLLNPIVIRPLCVDCLPDAPATRSQLDTMCLPVSLKYTFGNDNTEIVQAGQCSGWEDALLCDDQNKVSVRGCTFGGAHVFLAGDFGVQELLERCTVKSLQVEIHDRTWIAEEQGLVPSSRTTSKVESTAENGDETSRTESPTTDGDDEGYVCGLANISLIEFYRGYTSMDVEANVVPKSTMRGASLLWHSRPGRYPEAGTRLKLSIRLAVPIADMEGGGKEGGPVFGRAAFIFDVGDNLLFHALENTVRYQNACTLGFLSTTNKEKDDCSSRMNSTTPTLKEIRNAYGENLTIHTIQSLSTCKLTEEQAGSRELDILTGFHLISGKNRIIVIEGKTEGAMRLIGKLADAAVRATDSSRRSGRKQKRRKILINPHICYHSRLYASFGVGMWIIKLRSSLAKILSEGGTYASAQGASPECMEGLIRLQNLTEVKWCRQAHDLHTFPTFDMMQRIDKKFGGRLTKDEALGCTSGTSIANTTSRGEHHPEPLDDDEEEEESEDSRDILPTIIRVKPPLETHNKDYLLAKDAAASLREGRDFMKENIEHIPQVERRSTHKREEWLAWNPHASLQAVCEAEVGSVTKTTPSEVPGRINSGEARSRGWYPHSIEFKWPAPRDPTTYAQHPLKPSGARIEELGLPWVEGELFKPLSLRETPPGCDPFVVNFHSSAVFDADPESCKSVHLCGDSLEKERVEAVRRAKEEWQSKVVVDDLSFKTVCTTRKKVGQVDRKERLLKGEVLKKGCKLGDYEMTPISMLCEEPYEEQADGFQREVDPAKFVSDRNFANHVAREKRDVHKIGLDTSWGASLHDVYV